HSFNCNLCGLHFNVYSWLPDRHRTDTICCPECGQQEGKFRHYRTQLSESEAFLPDHPGEIFRYCPPPGWGMMNDSTMAGMLEGSPPEGQYGPQADDSMSGGHHG